MNQNSKNQLGAQKGATIGPNQNQKRRKDDRHPDQPLQWDEKTDAEDSAAARSVDRAAMASTQERAKEEGKEN